MWNGRGVRVLSSRARGRSLLSGAHRRLTSRRMSAGSSRSLLPLMLISVTDRMCAHEKLGFRKETRSSKSLRGMLICVSGWAGGEGVGGG